MCLITWFPNDKPVHCVTFIWSLLQYKFFKGVHTDSNLQRQSGQMSFIFYKIAKTKVSRVQIHASVHDAVTIKQLLDL